MRKLCNSSFLYFIGGRGMYFKEINIGGGTITALVTKLTEETTSTNKPYLNVNLSDGKSEEQVKYWDTTKESSGLEEGKVYDFILKCSMYNEKKSFTVVNYSKSQNKSAIDFIRKAPKDVNELFDNILNIINTMHDKAFVTLVNTIYTNMKPKILMWAAGKSHHHNYYGGLLWHTFRMVKTAFNDAETYENLDRDVIITACALHDIGKIEEFVTSEMGAVEYTSKGTLFGHLLLGYELVRKYVLHLKNEGIIFDDNKVTNLLHCIVSHHGEREWGAIVPPATPEAKFVFYQDLRDSQLTVFEEAALNLEIGEKTQVFHNNIYKL